MPSRGYSKNHTVRWGTPRDFFELLNTWYHFILDPCTEPSNPLGTEFFYTETDDGLTKEWSGAVFVNPPYSATNLSRWYKKCFDEWQRGKCSVIVLLVPARGFDSKRHHDWICSCEGKPKPDGSTCTSTRKGIEMRLLKGRLKFVDFANPGAKPKAGTFASMLLIFRPIKPYISW